MPKLQITMQRRPCIGVVRFALRVIATYRRYVTFLVRAHLKPIDSCGRDKADVTEGVRREERGTPAGRAGQLI